MSQVKVSAGCGFGLVENQKRCWCEESLSTQRVWNVFLMCVSLLLIFIENVLRSLSVAYNCVSSWCVPCLLGICVVTVIDTRPDSLLSLIFSSESFFFPPVRCPRTPCVRLVCLKFWRENNHGFSPRLLF